MFLLARNLFFSSVTAMVGWCIPLLFHPDDFLYMMYFGRLFSSQLTA